MKRTCTIIAMTVFNHEVQALQTIGSEWTAEHAITLRIGPAMIFLCLEDAIKLAEQIMQLTQDLATTEFPNNEEE